MEVVEIEKALEHHGILGMKWGQRRFQNKDGSLTDAGKKRYLNNDGSYNERAKKEIPRTALTMKDLQSKADRLRLENDIKRMEAEQRGTLSKFINNVKDNLVRDAAKSVSDEILSSVKEYFSKSKDNGIGDMSMDEVLRRLETGDMKGLKVSDSKSLLTAQQVKKTIDENMKSKAEKEKKQQEEAIQKKAEKDKAKAEKEKKQQEEAIQKKVDEQAEKLEQQRIDEINNDLRKVTKPKRKEKWVI